MAVDAQGVACRLEASTEGYDDEPPLAGLDGEAEVRQGQEGVD